MPPRVNQGQSSFSVSQEAHQVVCPLKNQDGTSCRKRCLGEKRYRSMQEHIRRAHPEHYISKLPATEESFQMMINTPPSARPPPQPNATSHPSNSAASRDAKASSAINIGAYGHERDQARTGYSSPAAAPRHSEDQYPAAATAAVALAQLHNQRQDSDWGSEADAMSEHEPMRPSSSYDLPPLQNNLQSDGFNLFSSPRPRELLPSILARSPPGRSTTLPPLHRPRPRKSSVTQNARKPKHERQRSKEYSRRMSIEGRTKAMSAEPQPSTAQMQFMNKRWEDLVEAAASANEADSDRDLTPVPQSPPSVKRSSMPPLAAPLPEPNAYKASPLQRVLTPPPPDEMMPEPFPSVESSLDSTSTALSGTNFHMQSSGLSNIDSSPAYKRPVQIYCAHCRRPRVLLESFACTECIGGFCAECVYIIGNQPCPRCRAAGARYKRIQLELL